MRHLVQLQPHSRQCISRTLLTCCSRLQEAKKFFWGYGVVLAALAALWLGKEAADFVRVSADNKRVDRSGFEVSSRGV